MKIPRINTLRITRALSHEEVDKKTRYRQIVEILEESKEPLSAKEISVRMFQKGYASTSERNLSHPRISELLRVGIVDVANDKKCQYTGKTVATFKLRQGVKLND